MTSRRDLLKAVGAGAAATAGEASNVLAQGATSQSCGADAIQQSETDAWLGQFDSAWRPLDPQLRAVLRSIYARLKGLPPPDQLSPGDLRRINAGLSCVDAPGRARRFLNGSISVIGCGHVSGLA